MAGGKAAAQIRADGAGWGTLYREAVARGIDPGGVPSPTASVGRGQPGSPPKSWRFHYLHNRIECAALSSGPKAIPSAAAQWKALASG